MTKPNALRLVKAYNKARAADSNVKAILTYSNTNRYEAVLIETETSAVVGLVPAN